MDHYDLKHCTQEDTIEFEILSNLSDEKKPHFKDGEPVRFMSIGDEYAIASLNNDTRVVKVKPTNAHYKSTGIKKDSCRNPNGRKKKKISV